MRFLPPNFYICWTKIWAWSNSSQHDPTRANSSQVGGQTIPNSIQVVNLARVGLSWEGFLTVVSSSNPGICRRQPSSSVKWKWNLFNLYMAIASKSFSISSLVLKFLLTSSSIPRYSYLGASFTDSWVTTPSEFIKLRRVWTPQNTPELEAPVTRMVWLAALICKEYASLLADFSPSTATSIAPRDNLTTLLLNMDDDTVRPVFAEKQQTSLSISGPDLKKRWHEKRKQKGNLLTF